MTTQKGLHLRDVCVKKRRGRGLASMEDSVNTSMRRLEDYIRMNKENLITAIRNNANSTRISERQEPENKNGKKNKCSDISNGKQGNLKREDLDMTKEGKPLERIFISS